MCKFIFKNCQNSLTSHFRNSLGFQVTFLYVVSIIGVAGNILVLIDSAFFWHDYPSGHSLIINLTVTGQSPNSFAWNNALFVMKSINR